MNGCKHSVVDSVKVMVLAALKKTYNELLMNRR